MVIGKSYVLSSGHSLTPTFTYTPKYTTRNFSNVSLSLELVDGGSGASYTVRGFPVEGMPMSHPVTSGTVLLSGVLSYVQISGVYDQVDVGVQEITSGEGGVISVYVTGRRK